MTGQKAEGRSQNERDQSVEIMILPAYSLQLIAYDWSEGRGQRSEVSMKEVSQ